MSREDLANPHYALGADGSQDETTKGVHKSREADRARQSA